MKISNNENFNYLVNFINDEQGVISLKDLLEFAIENKMYKDLYINYNILYSLVLEHNAKLENIKKDSF